MTTRRAGAFGSATSGQFTSQFALGGSYSSKIRMGKFDKYKGLFADAGAFDIPSNWSIGISFTPTPQWLLAMDYERIEYSDVPAVHNPSNLLLQCVGGNRSACLGGSNGAGFGWQSVNVFKLGVQYAINPQWTVRAGYNYSDNPIKSSDVTINILAPGVIQNHATLGATYSWDKKNELTGEFMYAFNTSVTGASLFNNFFPPPQPNMQEMIQMHQWSLGAQYAYKF